MREYNVYVCEKCGQEFTQGFPEGYNACLEHENSHIEPEAYGIGKSGSYQPGDKYPNYLTIPMADGAEVLYEKVAIKIEAEQQESPRCNEDDLIENPNF